MSNKYEILYVDDDPDWSEKVADVLKQSDDYSVHCAQSIKEVENFREQGVIFDAAIVDLGIGGGINWNPKSGEEVAQRLKEDGTNVTLFSGLTNETSRTIAKKFTRTYL